MKNGMLYRWSFGGVEFDESRWQLRLHGQLVKLEPRPLEVLRVLLRSDGSAVSRDELFNAVWPRLNVVEKSLNNAIGKLRRAIGDDDQRVIETVPKVGYRLNAEVTHEIVVRRSL